MAYKNYAPENEDRATYRAKCPRHVVEFELDATEDQKRRLFALNERVRKGSNDVVAEMRKRLEQMKRTKKYRALQKDYKWKADHLEAMKQNFESSAEAKNGVPLEESENYKAYADLKATKQHTGNQMSAMQRKFGVTKTCLKKLMVQASKDYIVVA